jgi:ABC-type nickel/cobalt efflux system permease component RcnA
MSLFRTISRISMVVSAALGAWRLWKTWRERSGAESASQRSSDVSAAEA